MGGAAYGSSAAAAAGGGGGDAASEYSFILGLYRQYGADGEEGIGAKEILSYIAREGGAYKSLTLDAILRISEQLMMDGHIYSTIDEQHYKPTS